MIYKFIEERGDQIFKLIDISRDEVYNLSDEIYPEQKMRIIQVEIDNLTDNVIGLYNQWISKFYADYSYVGIHQAILTGERIIEQIIINSFSDMMNRNLAEYLKYNCFEDENILGMAAIKQEMMNI